MTFLQRLALARLRQRALRQARAELDAYSERELNGDLGLSRSDIPELAAAMAEERVAAFRRQHPAPRQGRADGPLARFAGVLRQSLAIYGTGAWGGAGR